MIFRREPIHKKLAREAGLEQPEPRGPVDMTPNWGAAGIHGIPRQRRWDAVATAEAPGLEGDAVHFVALPNGDLVVDEDQPSDTLGPLAQAVEATLRPPYRAEGVRRSESVWAVAAKRIEVRAFPGREEDELELVEDDHVIIGHRLDGDLFHVEVTPL